MAAMIAHRPGFTLLELLCSLALLGVMLGMAGVPIVHARDELAVRAAQSAIVNAAAAARALAAGHGGAALSITSPDGTLTISTRDAIVVDTVARLGGEYHVAIGFDDGRAAAIVRFDALGLGRLANRTVRVQRGAVSGGVTFSAYGRARTW